MLQIVLERNISLLHLTDILNAVMRKCGVPFGTAFFDRRTPLSGDNDPALEMHKLWLVAHMYLDQ
jgi:hypothetical protein